MSSVATTSAASNALNWLMNSMQSVTNPTSADFSLPAQETAAGSANSAAGTGQTSTGDAAASASLTDARSLLLSIQEKFGGGATEASASRGTRHQHHHHGHGKWGQTRSLAQGLTGAEASGGGAFLSSTTETAGADQLSSWLSDQASGAAKSSA